MFKPVLAVSFAALFSATSALAMPDGHHQHDGMQMANPHQMHGMKHDAPGQDKATATETLKAEVVSAAPLQPGKPVQVTVRLTERTNTKPLTLDALKEVHTRKVHMLVVDPTLTDYHHVHPTPTHTPGEYTFTFTPQKAGYRIWVDVLPVATGRQEYVRTELGQVDAAPAVIDKTVHMSASVAGYSFTLALEASPKAGEPVMGSIAVARNGKPFSQLEPVMGAFAHVVGFSEDAQSVMHIHPMGQEPESASARGGPTLQFHLEPQTPGFIKLFAQVQINGQDIFAPFGIVVK
jgi:hypothetical protein